MSDAYDDPGQDDLLTNPAPSFSTEAVQDVARALYGLDGEFNPLVSERDQNFRITTAAGERFVIKIANSSEGRAVMDMQVKALEHIASVDPGLPVPTPVLSRNGLAFEQIHAPDGKQHCVRVLTYLPGIRPRDNPTDHALLRPTGVCLARLGLALRGFFHPAAGVFLLWDLKRSSRLRAYLPYVPDAEHRALAASFLDRFDRHVRPMIPQLRAQVIHNDLVPDNLLVAQDEPNRIVGIIDFGDVTHTPLINDLACTIASMMREHDDLVEAAAEIIAGYHEKLPLELAELRLLYDLIGTRLVAMGVIACWRVTLHSENRAYIFGGVERVWATLEAWRAQKPTAVTRSFFEACGP